MTQKNLVLIFDFERLGYYYMVYLFLSRRESSIVHYHLKMFGFYYETGLGFGLTWIAVYQKWCEASIVEEEHQV